MNDHISATQDIDLTINIPSTIFDIVNSVTSHVVRMTGHMTFMPNFLWGILLESGSLEDGTPQETDFWITGGFNWLHIISNEHLRDSDFQPPHSALHLNIQSVT
jgi:hypothetical protein